MLPTFFLQSTTDDIFNVLSVLLSLCQVVVPTRIGQMYVYDKSNTEQDEYDVPRHLPTSQDIYDVPPTRGQYNQQVTEYYVQIITIKYMIIMIYNHY